MILRLGQGVQAFYELSQPRSRLLPVLLHVRFIILSELLVGILLKIKLELKTSLHQWFMKLLLLWAAERWVRRSCFTSPPLFYVQVLCLQANHLGNLPRLDMCQNQFELMMKLQFHCFCRDGMCSPLYPVQSQSPKWVSFCQNSLLISLSSSVRKTSLPSWNISAWTPSPGNF